MKSTFNALTVAIGAVALTLLAVPAMAGCGDMTRQLGPFELVQPDWEPLAQSQTLQADDRGWESHVSIVGMWKVQFISKGNTTHNPPIPDGAIVDFGYSQWHSDGTEILNSGG